MPVDKQIITSSTSVSGTVTVPMQSYEYALVHVKVATGGDFDIAVSTTPTGISGDSAVSVIPSGTDVTDISDFMLEVGPTGAESVTVAWSNLSNNSVAPHTITAATGYVDGSNVNTNSSLTTDAGPRTGTLTRALTGLNCAPGADVDRATFASAAHAGDTGKTLTIANSADAGNDGAYTVTYVSGTAFDCVPDFSSPDTQVLTPAMTAILSDALVAPELAPGADIDRATFASAAHSGDTGKTLTIANSADAGNDGAYTVTYVSATAFDCVPDFSTPDTQVATPAMTAILSDALVNPTVAPTPDTDRLTCASAFIAADTGRNVTIANSADAANDGTYLMTYVSATAVDVGVPFSSADDQTETPAMTAMINTDVPGVTIAPGGDMDRVQSGPAFFAAGDVGRLIVVTGSANPANNGTYTIGTYVDANNVDVTTNFAATDTAGGLTVKLRLSLSSVELVGGMRRLAATGEFAAGDVGRTVTVAGSADSDNNGTYTIASFVDADNVELAERFASSDTGGTLAVTVSKTLSTVALAPGAVLSTLKATGEFAAGDVGRIATVTGSATGGNNGAHTISAYIDADRVTVTPAFTVPDIGGTLAVTVSKTLSTVALAPGTDYTKITSGSDMFSQYDPGRTIVIAAGANAGTYTVDTFTSATEIDVVETFPAITTGTAGTLTGTITGIDTAPGGDADRVHTATPQFAEVDEGATLSITGSTWALNGYLRLWSGGKK